ncbi:MAG: hypothetical protein KGL35_27440 [Bradyrhizobium sp.]|uniref:hypothetical protein n=1 Tax=Bradyrhizobium sp. TaxID=376 RepID=UPI001C2962F0|nr:hypothetical protein [Bradyrhizobium sp.]MBU6462136.1 hypothetical protein [Pseudomonadota bacterium]MDE2472365.1 hypothetical protein [Bradyrhizobium sp.]
MREMLLESHPLRNLGATLFEPEQSFAYLETAPQNLPPLPEKYRTIRYPRPPKPAVTFSTKLMRDPTVVALFSTPLPLELTERDKAKNRLIYYYRRPALLMIQAGELTPEQAAILFSTRTVATVQRWMEAGVPKQRVPKVETVLPDSWVAEIKAIYAREPRISPATAQRLLAKKDIVISDWLLRRQLQRLELGSYGVEGKQAAQQGRRFSQRVYLEEDCGPLPVENPTVAFLLHYKWSQNPLSVRSTGQRLRGKHFPKIHPLIKTGKLSVDGAAKLFRVKPATIRTWIAERDAFLAAGGTDPEEYRQIRRIPPAEWAKEIDELFSAEPGISGREAHRRLWERGYRQSYFIMRNYAKERGLTEREPEWCETLKRFLTDDPDMELREAHRRLEGSRNLPSYYTIRRYAMEKGLVGRRHSPPKRRAKSWLDELRLSTFRDPGSVG